MMNDMNYVIIGNSAAGIGAVEGIRQVDKTGKITVISSEPYHTYSRPLISYLVYGKVTEESMIYRGAEFYEKNHCETLLGKAVSKIDRENKSVILEDGKKVSYDKLLIATGSRPFVPPVTGLNEVKNQFTFMSLDDAKRLQAALTPESRVLIMGAGLIGLKAAEGISGKVKSIMVVDLANRILPSILDEDGSAMIKAHLEKQNVSFYLSDSVENFQSSAALLKSGQSIGFDILIIAVGVRPNTSLAAEAGVKVNRAIPTDTTCTTSDKDIYAAGDCTESFDVSSGVEKNMALLPNAYMQGECAGINMAGGSKLYDNAIPMNAIGFFGLHMITAGTYEGETCVQKSDESYKKLFFKDGYLSGYILIGDVLRAGIYTSMIKQRIPVDTVDYQLLCQKPQLMMFGKTKRKESLAGLKAAK